MHFILGAITGAIGGFTLLVLASETVSPFVGAFMGVVIGLAVANRFRNSREETEGTMMRMVVGTFGGALAGALYGLAFLAIALPLYRLAVTWGVENDEAVRQSGGALGSMIRGVFEGIFWGVTIGAVSGGLSGLITALIGPKPTEQVASGIVVKEGPKDLQEKSK